MAGGDAQKDGVHVLHAKRTTANKFGIRTAGESRAVLKRTLDNALFLTYAIQNKELKIRLSNYEQEKAHIIANARQLAIQEVRAPFEMLLRQKTDELDHCKDMYNNVLSEVCFFP